MPGDMTMALLGLILGWALGIATAVMWPRRKPLLPLGGPPRVHGGYQPSPSNCGPPTNLPQGTAAIAPRAGRVEIHFHGHRPTSEDLEHFREQIEIWLDEQERPDQCPVT